MEDQRGKIVGRAVDLLNGVYHEVNKIRDDVYEMLDERSCGLHVSDQYSYGSNGLHLKANHTFTISSDSGDNQNKVQDVFGIVVIFSEDGNLNRVNLREEPEIWFGWLTVRNKRDRCRPWDFYGVLKVEERKKFDPQPLQIGGQVFTYRWESPAQAPDETQEWSGYYMGHQLTSITDRDFLEREVISKIMNFKREKSG